MNAATPPTAADDPVTLLRAQLDTSRRTTVVPGQPLPPVVVVSETALRSALDELEQLRLDIAELLTTDGSVDDETDCPCGCQPDRPCDCGLEDCECIGDCPVCDADGTTYTISAAETTATRPIDGPAGSSESPTLPTPAHGAQQGPESHGRNLLGGKCANDVPNGDDRG